MSTSGDVQETVSTRIQHAKQPISAVAGPYGHPFHPTRVNSSGSAPLTDASYWLIGIGVIGALVAAVFGLMDLVRIPRGSRALRFGLTHLALNLTVVGLYIGNFLWRHDSYYESSKVTTGQLVLSAVAIGLLLISGWIGGMLAYRFGVRVAAERDQAEGYSDAYPS
jgi:uncharacterized membrane protein